MGKEKSIREYGEVQVVNIFFVFVLGTEVSIKLVEMSTNYYN